MRVIDKFTKMITDNLKEKENNKRNMNLDDPYDASHVKNYHLCEFVAIPTNFTIEQHLKMREQMGMFPSPNINLKQLMVLAEGVKNSSVTTIMNNVSISIQTCLYFIYILNELGVVLSSIHNPLRLNSDDYLNLIKYHDNTDNNRHYIRGQTYDTMNMIIVNVFHLFNEITLEEALGIAESLKKHQEEFDDNLKF